MKLSVLVAGLALSLNVSAEISFKQLSALVDNPKYHQGAFTQQKYLSAVEANLSSSGKFDYRRGESIRWHILKPIESELLLTPSGITAVDQRRSLLAVDDTDNSLAATIGEFLFALLTSDWNKLEMLFELEGEVVDRHWRAVLVPKDVNLAQVFSRIEIRGNELLEEIVMYETSGDRTSIRLDRNL